MTMKNVNIADLKSRLSEHLRGVRRGHPIVVLDRDTPIARLVPYEDDGGPLSVRHPLGRFTSVGAVPVPPAAPRDGDVVDLLLEDREGRR
jgi:prevent-host-death family protein